MNKLLKQAQQVLLSNRRNGYTIPTKNLYPFQWNWDSGFITLGYSHFDLEKAIIELKTLLSGQWKNGMIPHILFHSENETTYFPNYDFWQAEVNNGAPTIPKTSGISQPPVHGFIIEELWNTHKESEELKQFIHWAYPKVLASHRFYYQKRDPFQHGLLFIYHPWESGRDNSPIWDNALANITIEPDSIPAYTRKDIKIANPSERPTQDKYDRYVYLLELGKKYGYDGKEIAMNSPLLIQDVMMNSILIRSAKSMITIGRALNIDTSKFETQLKLSEQFFNQQFWNEEEGFYFSYDLRLNKQITHKEIGGLVALLSGVPSKEKAKQLNNYLLNLHERGYSLCPSFDVDSPLFDSKRYWRGPIWSQMNWMIHRGLIDYGFIETAEIVKQDFLTLVKNQGFYEYFEAQKHLSKHQRTGYGGGNFSWTAAITIDFILGK